MSAMEGTTDIILRLTGSGWLGIIVVDGREVFRSWDYYPTRIEAMARVEARILETAGAILRRVSVEVGP